VIQQRHYPGVIISLQFKNIIVLEQSKRSHQTYYSNTARVNPNLGKGNLCSYHQYGRNKESNVWLLYY